MCRGPGRRLARLRAAATPGSGERERNARSHPDSNVASSEDTRAAPARRLQGEQPMRQMRQLTSAADFAAMVAIGADAYPGTKVVTEEERLKLQQQLASRAEQPTVKFYGLFDD